MYRRALELLPDCGGLLARAIRIYGESETQVQRPFKALLAVSAAVAVSLCFRGDGGALLDVLHKSGVGNVEVLPAGKLNALPNIGFNTPMRSPDKAFHAE